IFHVLQIHGIHKLAMWVLRRHHPFPRRVDQIVIARLVVIYVILPNHLESLCENGNLRVAVIVFALRWPRFLRERAAENTEHETRQQWDDYQTLHIKTEDCRTIRIIAHEEILATPNRRA